MKPVQEQFKSEYVNGNEDKTDDAKTVISWSQLLTDTVYGISTHFLMSINMSGVCFYSEERQLIPNTRELVT